MYIRRDNEDKTSALPSLKIGVICVSASKKPRILDAVNPRHSRSPIVVTAVGLVANPRSPLHQVVTSSIFVRFRKLSLQQARATFEVLSTILIIGR